jgi:hypothetical protein
MNQAMRTDKHTCREFLRNHYSDEKLAMLLAHAQSGRLEWMSCCCFVGASNAVHPLGNTRLPHGAPLYMHLPNGEFVSAAFRRLANFNLREQDTDATRRRIIIPIIRAEMRRRDKLKAPSIAIRDGKLQVTVGEHVEVL